MNPHTKLIKHYVREDEPHDYVEVSSPLYIADHDVEVGAPVWREPTPEQKESRTTRRYVKYECVECPFVPEI